MTKTDWKSMELKTKNEIQKMKIAGEVLAKILTEISEKCVAGITTESIDKLAFKLCKQHDCQPTFFGYRNYPSALCVSVNDEIIHGIPGKKILNPGDIVGLDMGVTLDNWIVDSAVTVIIPPVGSLQEKLIATSKRALYEGIKASKTGNRLFDISSAIQNVIESNGFSAVREFVGHGVGRHLHEEPSIPNFVPDNRSGFRNVKILPGMTFALEPMVNEKSYGVSVDKDGWTVRTSDGGLSAHFEHTVAVMKDEILILTKRSDEEIEEKIKF